MDGFERSQLSTTEEKYREIVQAEIEYCSYCQPYDSGEVVWIHGDRIDLQDLFEDCEVPQKYWDNISSHLYCRHCGSESFDLGSDVGVKTDFEKEMDSHMDKVYSLYGSKVKKLEKLLDSSPLLAYKNKFARRIYKEIKNKELPITRIQKGIYYRAREVQNSNVLNSTKMLNAPLGKPGEGRFNHAGQSHLYLASDKETSLKEAVADKSSVLVWCQKFEIKKEIKDILDLSFSWSNITPSTSMLLLSLNVRNSIGRSDRNRDNWKPDYCLTRYIMDCAKNLGYNGIKYSSSRSSGTHNIVLFHPEDVKIAAISNPVVETLLNESQRNEFFSDLPDL